MKNHHDYPIVALGDSDVATLTIQYFERNGLGATLLRFGGDGSYKAYLVDSDCEIPDYYTERLTLTGWKCHPDDHPCGWLRIYDDDGLQFQSRFGEYCRIYRAGEYGVIIQIIPESAE